MHFQTRLQLLQLKLPTALKKHYLVSLTVWTDETIAAPVDFTTVKYFIYIYQRDFKITELPSRKGQHNIIFVRVNNFL